jgi:hypothetical protein
VKISKRSLWLWILPLLAGLALRLFFVHYFPTVTGDGPVYEDLANNWWSHHLYGLVSDGKLIPVDIRMPGYPALFLLMSHLFRRGEHALMLAQVFLDLGTCIMVAIIAGRIVPVTDDSLLAEQRREHVRITALWLAALCPFLANYCALVLTEVPATFCIAAAMLAFSGALATTRESALRAWFWGGFATAVGTLFRPETPLLLVALALVCAWRWRRRVDWPRLIRAGALTFCGLIIPLAPWAIRNAVTLHEFQVLAARYANEPGDFVPVGFYAWTKTWMVEYRYCYTIIWKITEDQISLDDIPNSAYDNDNERQRVATLITAYNKDCCDAPTADWDAQFETLAHERTARHPLRTYVRIPLERAFVLWFTPRIEALPYSGDLWPPGEKYSDDPKDFDITIVLWAIGFLYGGMALAGFIKNLRIARGQRPSAPQIEIWILLFLATYCVVRTLYLSRVETPEPRYVLECFPVVFVFAAMLWIPRRHHSSAGSG